MSVNSDKLISDFRNSCCNSCRIPWKSDVIGLRPSKSTWITCENIWMFLYGCNFVRSVLFKSFHEKYDHKPFTSLSLYASLLSSVESELYESADSSSSIFRCFVFGDMVMAASTDVIRIIRFKPQKNSPTRLRFIIQILRINLSICNTIRTRCYCLYQKKKNNNQNTDCVCKHVNNKALSTFTCQIEWTGINIGIHKNTFNWNETFTRKQFTSVSTENQSDSFDVRWVENFDIKIQWMISSVGKETDIFVRTIE